MSGLIFALVTCNALASEPAWADLGWGQPLPADAEEFHDPPWVGQPGERCVEQGDLVLCGDEEGLQHAHRRIQAQVDGGERVWLHTAGFEWTSGYRAPMPSPEGLRVERWGPHAPPLRGWESAWRVDPSTPAPGALEPAPATPRRPVGVRGGAPYGPALQGVEQALTRCGGASVDALPVAVLYDPSGEARMVRVQGFPPDGVDMGCVAEALGGPRLHPKGGVIELMVSLGDPITVTGG